MLYKFICGECENIIETIMPVAKMEEWKVAGVCEKCGKVGTQTVYFKNCPAIFYLGSNWTNAWRQNSRRGSKGQQNLDAALRENDALQWASTHDPNFIRAGDDVKKAQDQFGE